PRAVSRRHPERHGHRDRVRGDRVGRGAIDACAGGDARGSRDRHRDVDADRAHGWMDFFAADVGPVVSPSGGRIHDVHRVSVGGSLPRFRLAGHALLARLGRHSLFVYWIHVELVYGYASWLWRGRLPLWGTLAAYAAFSMLVYAAVVLIGVKSRVRVRPQPGR